jgi:tRNA threonylcarbamoyladenosine biosynthesis protein TsaE
MNKNDSGKTVVKSEDEMGEFARKFILEIQVQGKTRESATVVGLAGELGAGKSVFVRAVAKVLGVEEHIMSPTFVIMKVYDLAGQAWSRLVHIDAYRLEGILELIALGWRNTREDADTIVFIEWPENVEGALQSGDWQLFFRVTGPNERSISVL